MTLSIDSLFESSKMLSNYLSSYRGYNAFLIDEVNDNYLRAMNKAIKEENKLLAVKFYLKLDKQLDTIRDKHCFNNPDLPYRSSFRAIAKDIFLDLKDRWLNYNEDYEYIVRLMRFISSSDYYVIREYLMKRSRIMNIYKDIPLDPDDFYCGYIPLEAIMDYCIKIHSLIIKSY